MIINNTRNRILYITQAAIIAALYVVLTFVSSLFGLSSGVIQVRISEALCFLPIYTSAAIPGLGIGCVLANLLTGALPLDVIFGSLATLSAAIVAYIIRKYKYLSVIPNSMKLVLSFLLHL